jgi:hypothetical protein
MLYMRLKKLSVTSNPFLSPPPVLEPTVIPGLLESIPRGPPPSSEPIRRLGRVPPLVELVLRFLMAPATDVSVDLLSLEPIRNLPTNFKAKYEIIQPGETRISPVLLSMLEACIPGSVAGATSTIIPPTSSDRGGVPPEPTADGRTSPGRCPTHDVDFFRHAEERFTWERIVANVDLGAPGVPVRWRGCSHGCLDFLGSRAPEPQEPSAAPTQQDNPIQAGVVRFEATRELGFNIGIGDDF